MSPTSYVAQPVVGRVHWVGALDPGMRTFDVVLKTPNGTTYNAYVVRGSEGVAVIDTVKENRSAEFFARLESVARYDEIRAIVLNHLEPDHTGALPELLRRAPHAKLYISHGAVMMLKALLKRDGLAFHPVGTGDTVSLGDRTVRFLSTPYLHWPDTQCTYVEEDRILFSGDVFGCHFCDARLFNDRVGDFRFSFDYYYGHIMRPFKQHVIRALDLIEPLDYAVIAPTHGPILRDRPANYVRRYRELSTPGLEPDLTPGEKALVIFYISSYGSTTRMAEAIRDGAAESPEVRVSMYDLEGGEVEPFLDLVEASDGILIGSPTINGDAVKPAWDLLALFSRIDVKGKIGGAFGSYGWTGEAVRMLEDRLRGLKLRTPVPGARVKLIPTERELDDCRKFGRDVAAALTGRMTPREIDFAALSSA